MRRTAALVLLVAGCRAPAVPSPVAAPSVAPRPAAQNPSPMVETSRPHLRLDTTAVPGLRARLDSVLARPVELYVTPGTDSVATLIVHLMGAGYPAVRAASALGPGYAVASVYLGAGGGIYERAFADTLVFPRLVERARAALAALPGGPRRFSRVYVTAFSAGYGAVRAIVGNPALARALSGVLLLDGMHVSYVPEGKVLADGGVLDSTRMMPFVRFAERAVRGETRFVVTHSEIFPGTFASTTETADFLLAAIGVRRTRVLKDGPVGMQQTSEASSERFLLLGFAGNSAPDHIDHLQGLPGFLPLLLR